MTFVTRILKRIFLRKKVGKICRHSKCQLKLRHYEKATKFEKNLSPVLTKQLFLLSSVKTSGRLFQIFVAVSEKLNFNKNEFLQLREY